MRFASPSAASSKTSEQTTTISRNLPCILHAKEALLAYGRSLVGFLTEMNGYGTKAASESRQYFLQTGVLKGSTKSRTFVSPNSVPYPFIFAKKRCHNRNQSWIGVIRERT